jgi:hypothetical protein
MFGNFSELLEKSTGFHSKPDNCIQYFKRLNKFFIKIYK